MKKTFIIFGAVLLILTFGVVFYFNKGDLFQGKIGLRSSTSSRETVSKSREILPAFEVPTFDAAFDKEHPLLIVDSNSIIYKDLYNPNIPGQGARLTSVIEFFSPKNIKKIELEAFIDGKLIKTSEKDIIDGGSIGGGALWIEDLEKKDIITKCKAYTYSVTIDPENKIPESNEDNNTASLTFTVMLDGDVVEGDVGCKESDLKFLNYDVINVGEREERPDLRFKEGSKGIKLGDKVIKQDGVLKHINPYIGVGYESEVKNLGPLKNEKFVELEMDYLVDNKKVKTVKMRIDTDYYSDGGDLYYYSNYPDKEVDAWKFELKNLEGTGLNAKCKPHTFTAVLDSKNQVVESDESNNSVSITYTILDDGTVAEGNVGCKNPPTKPSIELESKTDFQPGQPDKDATSTSGFGDKPKEFIEIPRF